MSDSEEEILQRVKKPRTPAQLEATRKMVEARKANIELKKKQKEEDKQKKKEMKKVVKKKVEKEMSVLDTLSEEEINNLKLMAIGEEKPSMTIEEIIKRDNDDTHGEYVAPEPAPEPKPIRQRKQTKPKKKVVVNNYYEEIESSSEEEIVNNYYKKKKNPSIKKIKKSARRPTTPIESSSSEEESDIGEEETQPLTYSNQTPVPFNPMGDIIFC